MPYGLRKLPDKDLYKVFNKDTGEVHSKATTKGNALKQIRLLYMLERKKETEGGEISYPKLEDSLQQDRVSGEGCCAKCDAIEMEEIEGGSTNISGFPIVDYKRQRRLLQARKDTLQQNIDERNIRLGRLYNADTTRLTQQQVNQINREINDIQNAIETFTREKDNISKRIDRIDRMYGKVEESMDRNDGFDIEGIGAKGRKKGSQNKKTIEREENRLKVFRPELQEPYELVKPLASKTFVPPYQPTGKYMTPWRWVLYKERELQNSTYAKMMKDPSVKALYYKLKEKADEDFDVDWLEANYMKNRRGIKGEPKPKETKQEKLEKSLKGTKKITEFF